jgi:serine/threonine-protein kinase
MSSDPRVGTLVAGHRILSVIGRGGMSVVYLAEHLELERQVALKILGPELAEDEAFRERFIRESRVAAELDHPNIVTVYDAGEADGLLYLSMRYVEGSDLERLLRSVTALDPTTAVDLIAQCASALDAAHARGLVHRDVKPGNILLAPESGAYHAYLSDFGVTKRIHTGANLTRTGQFVGTVDYVAPEQIRSDDVDGRADVYSLACVLFRCLTGDVPFPRDTEVATIYAQLQDPPPAPSERRPGLPAGFDPPILRALAKERDERFDTCGAFADVVAGVTSTSAPLHAQTASARPGRGRGPRRGVLIGATVLVAVAVVAAGLLLDRPDSEEETGRPPATALPELSWTATVLPTPAGSGTATAAVDLSDTSIVGGWISEEADADAAVWAAASDGGWRRVRSQAFGGTADQRISALATDGTVVVAVGSESARDDTDAAVWRSGDGGASWTRVVAVTGGLHRPSDQAMLAIAHVAGGWIAGGWDRSAGDVDAAIWTSDDGSTWLQQTADPFGGPGRQVIAAMATAGDRIVAAGLASGPDGDLDAAVWLGTGGRWSRVGLETLGGPGDQRLMAVAADGDRIVVAGDETLAADPEPAVWSSEDGGEWARAPDDGLAGSGSTGGAIRSVVTVGEAWVAGGWTNATGTRMPAVWRSSDGVRWAAEASGPGIPSGVEGDPAGTVAALVDLGRRRLVAAGSFAHGVAVAWLADAA